MYLNFDTLVAGCVCLVLPDLGLSLAQVSFWLAHVRFILTQGLNLVSKVSVDRGRFNPRLCIICLNKCSNKYQ